ncbi:MAG: class I adenylate-forming enzyme family protein [Salinirussus sp.]
MIREWPSADPVRHRARTTPSATALIDASTGISRTYRDLDGAVSRCAATISTEFDLTDRPNIAIAATSSPAFAVALSAVWRAGAVAVPVPTDPAKRRQIDVDTAFALDPGEQFTSVPSGYPVETVEPNFTPTNASRSWPQWEPDETVLVLYTSGTTDEPKAVRLTPRNLVASAIGSAFRLGVDAHDRWFDCLPPHHMGGLAPFVRAPLSGGTVITDRNFDASRTAECVRRFDATGISVVPTLLRRLLDTEWTPPATLRVVLCGGAPTPPDLVREAAAAGVPLFPTYGTTETASQIATARPHMAFADPGTVGPPLVTVEVTIVDPESGDPVQNNTVGEVVVDGPVVSPGYVSATQPRNEYGLRTGDLACRTEDGRLRIQGRLDDAIQTGGETVHPARVAEAIRSLDIVHDVAVVGCQDSEWGERVVALAVPAEDATVTTAVIRDRLTGDLAPFELPREVATAERLPRTDSGTIDRAAVRRHFRE